MVLPVHKSPTKKAKSLFLQDKDIEEIEKIYQKGYFARDSKDFSHIDDSLLLKNDSKKSASLFLGEENISVFEMAQSGRKREYTPTSVSEFI